MGSERALSPRISARDQQRISRESSDNRLGQFRQIALVGIFNRWSIVEYLEPRDFVIVTPVEQQQDEISTDFARSFPLKHCLAAASDTRRQTARN